VYARRHFCADFQVCSPPEPLWNPRLREAATTLAAILADSAQNEDKTNYKHIKKINEDEKNLLFQF